MILDTTTYTPPLTAGVGFGVSQTSLGTPAVLRARTLPEFQQVKADAQAIPIVAREFSRNDRLLVRVPAYGPGGTAPTLAVRLLNRGGQPLKEFTAEISPYHVFRELIPMDGAGDLACFRVGHEVEVALAIAGFDVDQPVPFFGWIPETLA